MKITDLSHTIRNSMPVYPGTESPLIEYPYHIDQYGYKESRLHMVSHTGTHIDAPAHMIREGSPLDKMAADRFFGRAMILDVRNCKIIEKKTIQQAIRNRSHIDFVILFTGWSAFWGQEAYYAGYPRLSTEAADLLSNYCLKGIGVDAISFDKEGSADFPVHKTLLKKNILLVENLTNLDLLTSEEFWLVCAPLKFADSDGAPARVFSIEEFDAQNSEVK